MKTVMNLDEITLEHTHTGAQYCLIGKTIVLISPKTEKNEGEILLCQIDADKYRYATPDERTLLECQYILN